MNNKLLILALLTLANILGHSQVSIGINEAPVDGALLQLKNIPNVIDGSANSTKGMMLPRVQLTSMETLSPIADDTDVSLRELYKGTIVWSVGSYCYNNELIFPGILLWNGDNWSSLVDNKSLNNNVWTTTDQEGKSFRAGKFGQQIWMIDNLAVKTYDTESGVTANSGARIELSGGKIKMVDVPGSQGVMNDRRQASWAYPAPNPAPNPLPSGSTGALDGSDPYYYKSNREYGLLYTYIAATGGTGTTYGLPNNWDNIVDQRRTASDTPGPNEVESVETKGYIQGICPNGWHIPSDREWTTLEQTIFNDPESYSYISNEEQQTWSPNEWDPNWYTKNLTAPSTAYYSWRANNANSTTSNLAMAMKRSCGLTNAVDGAMNVLDRGKSFMPEQGGFNAIPAGNIAGTVTSYGKLAIYLSSSMGLNPTSSTMRTSINRSLYYGASDPRNNYVSNGVNNIYDFMSLKCVYHGDWSKTPFEK